MTIRERWKKSLSESRPKSFRNPDSFGAELEKYVKFIAEHRAIKNAPAELSGHDLEVLGRKIQDYRELYEAHRRLVDIWESDAMADLADRWRFLFFRIATAIGIAAVILGTYALADYWGIAMPMRVLTTP